MAVTQSSYQRASLPTSPTGWPVGSFKTYAEAQAAVDMLSDKEFPVEELTIVGVDLMQVENVHGRLTWGKVLGAGAASGAWMGLFIGLLLGFFSPGFFAPIISGLLMGVVFGMVFAAIAYGASGGKRDFTSTTAIVANRYDVLCSEKDAPRGRDLIAEAYGKIRPRTVAGRTVEGVDTNEAAPTAAGTNAPTGETTQSPPENDVADTPQDKA